MSSTATVLAIVTAPQVDYRRAQSMLVSSSARLRIFMMDLWCYTPQYDRYLCQSLCDQNTEVTLGSVSPYQDAGYFARNGLRNDPGLFDVVAKLGIPEGPVRRPLMLIESSVNMAALAFRFSIVRPDIIHVQWTPLIRKVPFELWFLRIAKSFSIKLVYTVHNLLPHDTGTRFFPVFKRMYDGMDALICHTAEAKQNLVREFSVDPQRIWVIPHGPLLHDSEPQSKQVARAQLSLPPEGTWVLWQGFVRPYKGLEFLLRAWQKIEQQGLDAHLLIAGSGEPEMVKSISDAVLQMGLCNSVRLDLRFIPEERLAAYYQAADVVVYPYRQATTSGALMAAIACRKPIVATNLPGFREILRDNVNALLVEYGDVDGLANSLGTLIREPTERNRLALAVASMGDFNSWERIARETRRCYATVLQSGQEQTSS